MTIRIDKAKELKKAIVNKVDSVLSNTDIVQRIDISIHGSVDEVTTIYYRVEETIVPKEGDENA